MLFGWAINAQQIPAASADKFKRVERCVLHLLITVDEIKENLKVIRGEFDLINNTNYNLSNQYRK